MSSDNFGQKSAWTNVSLDNSLLGQKSPWTIVSLDKSLLGQKSLGQTSLGQKSPWTKVSLDKSPLGQTSPWTIAPWTIVPTPFKVNNAIVCGVCQAINPSKLKSYSLEDFLMM